MTAKYNEHGDSTHHAPFHIEANYASEGCSFIRIVVDITSASHGVVETEACALGGSIFAHCRKCPAKRNAQARNPAGLPPSLSSILLHAAMWKGTRIRRCFNGLYKGPENLQISQLPRTPCPGPGSFHSGRRHLDNIQGRGNHIHLLRSLCAALLPPNSAHLCMASPDSCSSAPSSSIHGSFKLSRPLNPPPAPAAKPSKAASVHDGGRIQSASLPPGTAGLPWQLGFATCCN